MGAAGEAARAGALRRVPWALLAPLLLLLTVLIAPAFIKGDAQAPRPCATPTAAPAI